MTHDMPTARFIATSIAILLATAAILVLYARAIRCSWCDARFAIWPRRDMDLCRTCAGVYDRETAKRRPLPWRRR